MGVHLPVMLETALAVSKAIVILAGLATGLAALAAGCSPVIAAVRAGAALFGSGLLVWFANWFLAHRSLAVLKAQIEETGYQPAVNSTIEREA